MKQIIQKTSILRYGSVILLISVLIGGILYSFAHTNKTKNLERSVARLIAGRENNSLIDSCIISLYSADNYSRLYTITGDKDYLTKFTNDVKKVNFVIEKLQSNQNNQSNITSGKLKNLFNIKKATTNTYIKLRLLADSLINSASNIRYDPPKTEIVAAIPIPSVPVVKVEHHITLDTLKKPEVVKPKKKLFGRLLEAIAPKKPDQQPTTVVIQHDQETTFVSNINSNEKTIKPSINKNYYQQIKLANNNLRKKESQVLMVNNSLIDEIVTELRGFKAIDQYYIDMSKEELKQNISSVSFESNRIYAISLGLLLVLALLVFYNLWKIYSNETKILKHSAKTELYAESKSRFLAGMSHEIRTPLNSIIGFSEQLAQNNLLPAQKEQVNAIKSSSEMLIGLVNDILDFTKYETGKISFESSSFLLHSLFEDVFRSMQVQASKKQVLLINQIAIEKTLRCDGDSIRLKQVLMNLLSNAIKFTVKGNVILNAQVENTQKIDVLLKVAIVDSGLGIAPEDLLHIFEEFTQVSTAQKATKQKGTGLGLAICKKIIELQGGHISAVSELGKGSEFSFELPLKKSEFFEADPAPFFTDEEMAELVHGTRVLFVEDNKLNVLLGSTILKKWKINFDIAYNGHEAYDLFQSNDYDIVITDIQMPEMDGLELAKLIRRYHDTTKSSLPIVALTASVLEEERDIFFNSGFNFIVLKPFKEKELIEKISLSIQNNFNNAFTS